MNFNDSVIKEIGRNSRPGEVSEQQPGDGGVILERLSPRLDAGDGGPGNTLLESATGDRQTEHPSKGKMSTSTGNKKTHNGQEDTGSGKAADSPRYPDHRGKSNSSLNVNGVEKGHMPPNKEIDTGKAHAHQDGDKKKASAKSTDQGGKNDSRPTSREGQQGDELFQPLDGLQPLPSRSERNDPSRPGAHPVAGMGHQQSLDCSLEVTDTDCTEVHAADCTAPRQGFLASDEVEGENLSDLEEAHATPLPERNANKMPHKWFCVVATVVLAASLLVFLIVWLVLQSQSSDEGQVGANTPKEMTNKNPPFQEDLSVATLRAIQEDPDSPESRANEWMWDDPYLEEYTKERQRQRFGMVTLYFSTQGDQWSHNDNWLDYEVSECLWFSKATVEPICDEQESILTLDLHSNNLNGTLCNDLWLAKPRHLNVANNFLQGAVPPFPSESEQLEVLILSNNNFTGGLTGEGRISVGNLRVCMIDSNSLYGIATANIYPLISKLEIFNFTSNNYAGPVSPNLQYLTNLRSFGGGHNQKEGPLATELGLLTKLEVLEYSFNTMVTGTIPTEFGLLTNLLHLDLDGTHLTGSLPEQFCVRQEQDLLHISVNCSSLECC